VLPIDRLRTIDSSWGQAFTYDGFGNRISAPVTKGSAAYGNWSYYANTNWMVNNGYDANGNMTSAQSMAGLVYDVECSGYNAAPF